MIDTGFIGVCYPGWDCILAYGSIVAIALCIVGIIILGVRQ